MARYTYTGKLTDFGRTPFPASANVELRVVPVQPGYGGDGLLSDRAIPVTVATDGSFSVRLESSASVRPEALYKLQARWLATEEKNWSDWAVFRAATGGGNIAELAQLPTPAWAIAYGWGPPAKNGITAGLYIDISGVTPVLYAPEGAKI